MVVGMHQRVASRLLQTGYNWRDGYAYGRTDKRPEEAAAVAAQRAAPAAALPQLAHPAPPMQIRPCKTRPETLPQF